MKLILKSIITVVFVFFSVYSFSKDNDSIYPKSYVGFSGGYLQLGKLTDPSYFNHEYISKSGIGYGLNFEFQFNKFITLALIPSLFSINYNYSYSWIFLQANDPSIPKLDEYKTQYFDLPVILKSNFLNFKNWNMFFSIGMSGSLLQKDNSQTTYQDNSVRDNEKSEMFLLSYNLNLGFQFLIKQKSKLLLWTEHRQFLTLLDTDMITKPNNFGVYLGFISEIEWKCMFKKGAWQPLPKCKN